MAFRMKIRDVFDIRGRGIVVLGTIEHGGVRVGDQLLLVSATAKRPVRVASIEKFQLSDLQEAHACSDDVGIGLADVTREQVSLEDLLTKET